MRAYDAKGAGSELAVTTTRATVTVPNLVAAGFASPSGGAYPWKVLGHGAADLDDVARGGLVDDDRLNLVVHIGGPGGTGDAAFTLAIGARTFTFAPRPAGSSRGGGGASRSGRHRTDPSLK